MTQRKAHPRQQHRSASSGQQLKLALASAGMGSFEWDIPRERRYFDAAFHRLMGLDPESFDGTREAFYAAIHPEDRDQVSASLHRALETGEYETECRAVWPDGSVHHIAARGRVYLDPQGRPDRLRGIGWDITRQKLAEEALLRERRKADSERRRYQERLHRTQALEALGVLVAGVAHTLNNVLAVIMGTASLREQLATQEADLQAYRNIGKACRRGRDVVKSLIQFSQPTLSAQAPFELHGLIREVAVLLEHTTRNRVRIQADLDPQPVWVHGDAGSINLVLVNLCFNAMEAMPHGGTLTLATGLPAAGWVEVRVEDDGQGMTGEVLGRALEPFFTTKDASSGAGLGLSMAYGVVKAHGGTLDISSQPGAGTSVKVRLPRIPAPEPGEPERAQAPAHQLREILLVDDEEDVRFLMGRMLRKAGVPEVETAAGGAEALARLGSGSLPDLVILDQNMPGMSGAETMERIRSRFPDLPILFSSGQPDLENWERLRQPGVAVIAKPFTLEEIQAKLGQLAQGPRTTA